VETTATRRRRGIRRLTTYYLAATAVAAGILVAVIPSAQAADQAISVNFATTSGSPTYRASGWIYGMTENAAAPPDHFFKDVKFRYMRAGGAQLPGGGWVSGNYDRRWNATKAQLMRTRSLGGEFVLLVHDLWGADGASISRFPGDNGDWTDYDSFLTRLISDVKATGAPVEWDLWNEPNISIFWNRTQSQYFELWRRTYQRIRAAFPSHLIVGPSCACVPSTTNTWWGQYLDYVKANSAVPDIISWHALPSDPVANVAAADTTLNTRGIAHSRPYQINEYGASNEQNPAGGAWYIARLERAGADGLRANWASGSNLHNDLASLLVHDSSGQYQPKGEWWAYQFYGSQTGQIASVTASSSYDGFATKAEGSAKVLVGGSTTGNISVNLQHLDSTSGVVQNSRVRVLAQRIPYNNGAAVSGPVTVQDSVVTVSGNAATINLSHTTAQDAFTITLLPPDGSGPSSASPSSGKPSSASPSSASPSSGRPSSTSPVTGGSCNVSYDVSAWATGLTANATITNTGTTPVSGWSLVFTLPGGQNIVSGWNATYAPTSGQVTAKNVSYNGGIPAGGSTTIGFQATHTGNAAEPTSFALNGTACSVS
jgi:hypothetical protein